jgi:hypothetical protein
MRFFTNKKGKALEARVANLERALANGRVHIQTAQTNVTQPGGASTLIQEGPTAGETKFKGAQFDIILTNPNAH